MKLILAILLLSLPLVAHAQDDPVAIAIERAVNRAILAEAKVELYEEKLKAKDERIEALNLQVETLKEQKKELLSATKDRRDAGNIDAERLADARTIIAKQDAEINRLRNPSFLSQLFDRRTIYGAVGGYGLCKLTTSDTFRNPFIGSSGSQFSRVSGVFPQSQFSLYQSTAEQKMREAMKRK